jgi:ribonuclease-3
MRRRKTEPRGLEELEEKLGHQFRDRSLLIQALSHSSTRQEGMPSNERLEFLGDAVLGFIITTYLYDAFPGCDEGGLSIKRAQAVSHRALGRVAREIHLDHHLAVARGIRQTGAIPETVMGDAMEALIGAVFLDGGTDRAWTVVTRHFHRFVRKEGDRRNPKSALQNLVQKREGIAPRYRTVAESGLPHARRFTVRVEVGGRVLAEAQGSSRKRAEHEAARRALAELTAEDDAPAP